VAVRQVFLRVFGVVLSPFVTTQHCCLSDSGACTEIKCQGNASVKSVACQLCVYNNLRDCVMLRRPYLRLKTELKQTRVDSYLCYK